MLTTQEYRALDALSDLGVLVPDLKKTAADFYPVTFRPQDLDSLTAKGLVARKAMMFAPTCPNCTALMLTPNGSCPTCREHTLTAIPLLHHIPCAGIFDAPEGIEQVEQCPKCRSQIQPDSELLETAGEMHYCQTCETRFPDPVISMYCHQCKNHCPLHDARFSQVHSYAITEAGKNLLKRST